ncbi:MAG: MmgE/PrpD family protein [Bradyrhizobium sp.]
MQVQENSAADASSGLVSEALSNFASSITFDSIPPRVIHRAVDLLLDGVGIAYASSTQEFARSALRGLSKLGAGSAAVIGMNARLPLRDAVLMNSLLVHGLDFDDTHMEGIIHASASCFPCALGVAAYANADAKKFITAYILGLEIATRLSMVANGKMHERGFHPTGLVGAFACVLIAGKLIGLNPRQLTMAQGIALSLAAGGSQEFLTEGAWTKRLHPGCGASAGITAALLASEGFVGPTSVYEGRYGLFEMYLGNCMLPVVTAHIATLGRVWETEKIAIKPFPVCHYSHGAVEAALTIAREYRPNVDAIASIDIFLPAKTHHIVCEPIELKLRPSNDYDARFSAPFAIAVALCRGVLGLAELEPDCRNDPKILALAAKIRCLDEVGSAFPRYFSGKVDVTMNDGQHFTRQEVMNLGCPDRPRSVDELQAKFMANATLALSPTAASHVRGAMRGIENSSAAEIEQLLMGNGERRR